MLASVDLLDDDGLPVSKAMLKNLLDMFIAPDLDSDNDGQEDAASVGIKFATISGTIAGVEP